MAFSVKKTFVAWLVWMVVGVVFYKFHYDCSWELAIYNTVSIGYNVGWGWPFEKNDGAKVFSAFYLLIGEAAATSAIQYFCQRAVANKNNWIKNSLEKKETQSEVSSQKWRAHFVLYKSRYAVFAFWISLNFAAAIWSCAVLGWSAAQGFYFAISVFGTGGLWPIPPDSDDSVFLGVALFEIFGIPFTGVIMGIIGEMVLSFFQNRGEVDEIVHAPVCEEEIAVFSRLGLENGDGVLSRGEYIILCAVRLGMLNPDLAIHMRKHYEELGRVGTVGNLKVEDDVKDNGNDVKAVGNGENVLILGRAPTRSQVVPLNNPPTPQAPPEKQEARIVHPPHPAPRGAAKKLREKIRQQLAKGTFTASVHNRCTKRCLKSREHGFMLAFFFMLAGWLFAGSMVYAVSNELGPALGLYQAVSVGMAVGFSPSEKYEGVVIFAAFFHLYGLLIVGCSLGFFAEKAINNEEQWWEDKHDELNLKKGGLLAAVKRFFINYGDELRVPLVWLVYMSVYWTCAVCVVPGWNAADGFYFSMSTLSTAGSWPIPGDSPDWLYALVGVFTFLGVPLNFVTMNVMTQLLLTQSCDLKEAEKQLTDPPLPDECQHLLKIHMGSDDGKLSYSEYVLISGMRLGIFDDDLIGKINARFDQLDTNKTNSLSFAEISPRHPKAADKQARADQVELDPLKKTAWS